LASATSSRLAFVSSFSSCLIKRYIPIRIAFLIRHRPSRHRAPLSLCPLRQPRALPAALSLFHRLAPKLPPVCLHPRTPFCDLTLDSTSSKPNLPPSSVSFVPRSAVRTVGSAEWAFRLQFCRVVTIRSTAFRSVRLQCSAYFRRHAFRSGVVSEGSVRRFAFSPSRPAGGLRRCLGAFA
jgi:hypothetical protein